MNTDDLRTLLKEAGRPVPAEDPVPVIRRRARRYRQKQAAVAAACTAMVAAAVVGAVDLGPRDSVAPAGRSAQGESMRPVFPFRTFDPTPQQVGGRNLLDDPPPRRDVEANGGLHLGLDGLRSDDLVRVRLLCPTATGSDPVMVEVSLTGYTEQQLDPPPTAPGKPVQGPRKVSCADSVTSTDFVVPAAWPWYGLVRVDMEPNEIRSVLMEVAAYR